jgi:hypothetical protein
MTKPEHVGLSADFLDFRMPPIPGTKPADLATYTIEAILLIAKASSALSKAIPSEAARSIIFTGIKGAGTAGLKRIRQDQLFEAGTVEVLSLFTDLELVAAQRALQDASDERDERARRDRLIVAETHLTSAFSASTGELKRRLKGRNPKKPNKFGERVRTLHANALVAAAVNTSNLKELESYNVDKWAARADTQHNSFEYLTKIFYSEEAAGLRAAELEREDARLTAGKLFSDATRGGFAVAWNSTVRIPVAPVRLHVDRAYSASVQLGVARAAHEQMTLLARLSQSYVELRRWWTQPIQKDQDQ